MAYNLTFTDTADTFYDVMLGVNNELGGGIALVFLAALFIVTFIVYNKTDEEAVHALLVSGFFTSIIGFLLWSAGFVAVGFLFIPIVITIGALLVLVFS